MHPPPSKTLGTVLGMIYRPDAVVLFDVDIGIVMKCLCRYLKMHGTLTADDTRILTEYSNQRVQLRNRNLRIGRARVLQVFSRLQFAR